MTTDRKRVVKHLKLNLLTMTKQQDAMSNNNRRKI